MRHYACGIPVREGRILLGRRAPHRKAYPGCWDVIGGLVEDGETVADALRREFGEEIGIVPLHPEFLCHVIDRGPQVPGEATSHMYLVRRWDGGEPFMANNEHTSLDWFTIEQACALADLALPEYADVFRKVDGCPQKSHRPVVT